MVTYEVSYVNQVNGFVLLTVNGGDTPYVTPVGSLIRVIWPDGRGVKCMVHSTETDIHSDRVEIRVMVTVKESF